jgi:hypothetical protein
MVDSSSEKSRRNGYLTDATYHRPGESQKVDELAGEPGGQRPRGEKPSSAGTAFMGSSLAARGVFILGARGKTLVPKFAWRPGKSTEPGLRPLAFCRPVARFRGSCVAPAARPTLCKPTLVPRDWSVVRHRPQGNRFVPLQLGPYKYRGVEPCQSRGLARASVKKE